MLQTREVRSLRCLSQCLSHSAVIASLSVIKGTFKSDEPEKRLSCLSLTVSSLFRPLLLCFSPRVQRRMSDRLSELQRDPQL